MKAGSTPLPAVWALEESHDLSNRFKGVRYYVADQEDCFPLFGVDEGPLCLLRPTYSWKEDENVSIPFKPLMLTPKILSEEIPPPKKKSCTRLTWKPFG